MTKAQRADALLEIVGRWQNGQCWMCSALYREDAEPLASDLLSLVEGPLEGEPTSAALSEVTALGFDIDGAEHVTSFEPCGGVRREDGTSYKLYKAARR